MQFHNYKTMKPSDWRGTSEEYIRHVASRWQVSRNSAGHFGIALRAMLELSWIKNMRPFYNVYPIAVELCATTKLSMSWGDILLPTKNLLLRFPAGHEPFGVENALLRVPSEQRLSLKTMVHDSWRDAAEYWSCVQLGGLIQRKGHGSTFWTYESHERLRDEKIKETTVIGPLNKSAEEAPDLGNSVDFLIRLLAFVGLLASGTDLITPAILAADREEYDATTDESRKRWLEARAAKRQGVGFDIGRSMEIERATSPHWRCPHLALFHTGPGRTVPVLKVRSGCVVIPKDMSHVPTGYMGAEKPGEPEPERKIVFRTPVPKKMRFRVFRRDNYRCRLCGMTSQDGVRLECDHIVPVAKGGKTVPGNLWTLCQPCNSGKSDSDLHKAIEDNKAANGKAVKHGV